MTHKDISRRSLLQGLGGAISGLTITGTTSAQQSDNPDWAMFGHGRGNTGYNSTSQAISVDVERKWRFSAQSSIASTPVAVNETVYATGSGNQVYSVSSSGETEVYSLDGQGSDSSGNTPEPIRWLASSPTVHQGILYVGGLQGTVYAFDTNTQEEQWRYQTSNAVRSSPKVVDQTVYIGSDDGTVNAIDAVSGSESWEFTTDGAVTATPAIVGNTVTVANADGLVYGLDADSGNEQWRRETDNPIFASPVANESTTYITNHVGQVTAHAVNDGDVQWTKSLEENVTATPTLVRDTLIAGTTEGTIYAINTDSGAVEWQRSLDGAIEGGLAASSETVYIGTSEGSIYGLEIETGDTLWSFAVESSITAPVTIANGRLYVGTDNGNVFALGSPSTLETLPTTITRTTTETLDSYGQEIAGVLGGGITVLGGYAGLRRIRRGNNTKTPKTADSIGVEGEAAPIGVDRPSIPAGRFPDLSELSYDEFSIGDIIGSGGNADVKKATVSINGEQITVALKTPRMSDYETVSTDFFEEFVEEARLWDTIDDHDNIVTVLGWGEQPHPWIALEYMNGGNLEELNSDLGYDEKFVHLESMAEAVHHAHRQGITHTDLKPENILFTTHSGQRIAKITDWGLATVLLEHSKSVQGLTPAYSAPEQIDPDSYGGTDDRTDIYQLGVVAYEMFTGELPFDRSNYSATMNAVLNEKMTPPSEHAASLPSELDAVLERALAKEKSQRYETVLHFRDALRRVYHQT